MEKEYIVNKILEYGGKMRKNPFQMVRNFYPLYYTQMPQTLIH